MEREHIASRLLRCPRLSVGGVSAGPNRGSSVLASSGNFLGAPLKVGHPADMTDLHLGAFESFLNSWLPSDPCRCPARGRRVGGGRPLWFPPSDAHQQRLSEAKDAPRSWAGTETQNCCSDHSTEPRASASPPPSLGSEDPPAPGHLMQLSLEILPFHQQEVKLPVFQPHLGEQTSPRQEDMGIFSEHWHLFRVPFYFLN